MKRGLLVMLLCAYCEAYSAFEHLAQGSGSIAMGGASVAMRGNPWASFSNPGGLTTIDSRVLSLYYSPQPFGLKELVHGSFSYVEPTTIGTFAASGSKFGFELYREIDLGVSFGTAINDLLSIGAGLHYYHLAIERYGSTQTLGVDLGFVAQLSDQLRWGCVAYNVNGPTMGQDKERLPQVFTTGVAYSPVPEATIVADLEKDIRYPLELHAGVQYLLLDLLALRAGTTSDPSMLSAGLGIHYSFVQFDYAFTNHAELGPTHQFSLSLFSGEF